MSLLLVLVTGGTSANASPSRTKPSPYDPASKYLDIAPVPSDDLSHPYVKGKVVVVTTDDHSPPGAPSAEAPRKIDDSWDFNYPSPELHPKHADEVGTIVWKDCANNPVGSYANGKAAYEADCVVTIIDKAANQIVGEKSFTVPPPTSITSNEPYGSSTPPDQEIGDYIAGLPRRSVSGQPIPPTTNPTGPGLPWREQKVAPGTESGLAAIAFSDATHGWAVGKNGTIVATADGGATWTAQNSGTKNPLSGVAFVDATHGWAVGGTILATTDGGATWSAQDSGTSSSLSGVAFVDATHGWAVGDGGTILATADGGATWTAQNSGTSSSLSGVAFVDPTHGWAVGPNDGTIVATADGGATWSAQNSGTTSLTGVAFVDATRGSTVGGITTRGTILATTDAGANWKRQKSPTSKSLSDVTFVDATHGWAVGQDGTIVATTDGGANWKRQKSSTSKSLSDVTFVDATHGWAVGEGGTMVATTNGGSSSNK